MDDIASFQRVQMLRIIQVPEHHSTILATRSAQSAIRGDGHGVDVTGMSDMVNGQGGVLALHVPDLDHLVPTTRDDQRVNMIRGETHSRDPLSVAKVGATRAGDGELTLEIAADVPNLHSLVARPRNDEAIIRREGARHDVIGVSNEGSGGLASLQIPQTHGLVPGGSKTELAIAGEGNITDEVIVTTESSLGDAKALTVGREVPDECGLVYTLDMLVESESVSGTRKRYKGNSRFLGLGVLTQGRPIHPLKGEERIAYHVKQRR